MTGEKTSEAKRGRPKSIDGDIVTLKTRMPHYVHSFLGQISYVPGNYLFAVPEEIQKHISTRQISISLLHEAALRTFLHEKPWETERGFTFYAPQIISKSRTSEQDWVQINVRVPKELADEIFISDEDPEIRLSREPVGGICKTLDISMAAFLWTCTRWFIQRIGEQRDKISQPSSPELPA